MSVLHVVAIDNTFSSYLLTIVEDITQLKKLFSSRIPQEIMTANSLRTLVDATPHVQVANEVLSGSYYVAFIEGDTEKAYESYLKWIRNLPPMEAPDAQKIEFFVSKKGHLMKLMMNKL